MRIAIFGGSFDPIHTAHVVVVKEALKELHIDMVIVVPTYLNPFKSSFYLDPETRFKLLEKVFKDFDKVQICDYEINQQKTSYSIDTVNYLRNLYNPSKIYFIIGEDNLKTLDKWHEIDKLKELVEFVVASRKGFESKEAKKFKNLDVNINISSSSLRDKIDLNYIPKEIKDDILNLQEKGKSF
ncbi:MAG: nicotinate (nicotinamide) nucleotide adenylyltransferase [Aliarcobacter sp.]|nr:nicotinate (nicotinamide) nucleotide adenylyltransferase [Aliarcobacter sp.]